MQYKQCKIFALFFKKKYKLLTAQVAARAFALLGRCGGGGNLGVKHVESWTVYCNKLIGTLHDTVDKLYQGFEISKFAKYKLCSWLCIAINCFDEIKTPRKKICILFRRLKKVFPESDISNNMHSR